MALSQRRSVLALLCCGALATALDAAADDPPSEVEIGLNGYTGQGETAWACGPSARVKYGGLGGTLRWQQLRKMPRVSSPSLGVPEGLSLETSVVMEQRSFTLLSASSSTPAGSQLPPGAWMYAANFRYGYDWRYLGLRMGSLAFPVYKSNTQSSPSMQPFPELSLRAGPIDLVYGELGLGSYNLPTMTNPGVYAGVGVNFWQKATVMSHLLAALYSGTAGSRWDLSVRGVLTDHASFEMGGGLSLSGPSSSVHEPMGWVQLDMSF